MCSRSKPDIKMEPGSGRPVDYQVSGWAKATSREMEAAVVDFICFHHGLRFTWGSPSLSKDQSKLRDVAGIVKPVINP